MIYEVLDCISSSLVLLIFELLFGYLLCDMTCTMYMGIVCYYFVK